MEDPDDPRGHKHLPPPFPAQSVDDAEPNVQGNTQGEWGERLAEHHPHPIEGVIEPALEREHVEVLIDAGRVQLLARGRSVIVPSETIPEVAGPTGLQERLREERHEGRRRDHQVPPVDLVYEPSDRADRRHKQILLAVSEHVEVGGVHPSLVESLFVFRLGQLEEL